MMDIERYDIFNRKYNDKVDVYIDVVDVNNLRCLVNNLKKSKYGYTQKRSNNVDYILQKSPLRPNERYTIIIESGYNSYYITKYNINNIEGSRNMVLSYLKEKQIVLKITKCDTPSYKPKKIERVI